MTDSTSQGEWSGAHSRRQEAPTISPAGEQRPQPLQGPETQCERGLYMLPHTSPQTEQAKQHPLITSYVPWVRSPGWASGRISQGCNRGISGVSGLV